MQGSQKQVGTDSERRSSGRSLNLTDPNIESGMVLPFEPMIMTFRGVHYYVDLPPVSPPGTQSGQAYSHLTGGSDISSRC